MDIRSNEPFWLIKNALTLSYPSLKESTSTEVLIIGAGITGALMAYKPIGERKKVIMVDSLDICNAAAAASTSISYCI